VKMLLESRARLDVPQRRENDSDNDKG